MFEPKSLSERIRGNSTSTIYMDSSTVRSFDKYPDKPGQVSQKISPEFSEWLNDIADEVESLESAVRREYD